MPAARYIKNRLWAFIYAFRGIRHLIRTEPNVQVQVVIALLVTLAGFYFDISTNDWMLQIFAIGLVLCAEALNTAIEKIADFIHPDYNIKIGHIKDMAAGAVTIASLGSFIIGLLIYWPHFKKLLF